MKTDVLERKYAEALAAATQASAGSEERHRLDTVAARIASHILDVLERRPAPVRRMVDTASRLV